MESSQDLFFMLKKVKTSSSKLKMRHLTISRFTGKPYCAFSSIEFGEPAEFLCLSKLSLFVYGKLRSQGMVSGKGSHAGLMGLHTLLNVRFRVARVSPTTLQW